MLISVSLSYQDVTGERWWFRIGGIMNPAALFSWSVYVPVVICSSNHLSFTQGRKTVSEKSQETNYCYFTNESIAPHHFFFSFNWVSHFCGFCLTNTSYLCSLQVACHFISLYFDAGHMVQMQYWWQKATVQLSWHSPRCFISPSKLQLVWFTWHHSTLCIGILLPGIAWLVRTYWWRLGILGCLEMCTARTTIG